MKRIGVLDDGRVLYAEDIVTESISTPYLFLDNFYIESSTLNRVVPQPVRHLSNPVLNNTTHKVYNFSSSVLYDGAIFRAWYGVPGVGRIDNAFSTSLDGVNWELPRRILVGPGAIGNVLQDGNLLKAVVIGDYPNPPQFPADMYTSIDGVSWNKHGQVVSNRYGERWTLFRDEFYGLLHRWNQNLTWVDAEGRSHTNTIHDPFTRCYGFTSSLNGSSYLPSRLVFTPGREDSGETQFYNVSNLIRRGGLWIGCLNVLRDDLIAINSPAGSYGTGYTVLIWSRDGVNWNRHAGTDPHLLDPNPDFSSWDHAVTWVTSITPVGDEIYLYYGGYKFGHKVFTDRQIGMVKIKPDRWVGRRADTQGVLKTNTILLHGDSLTVNSKGRVRVQITDLSGNPIPGYHFDELPTLTGDNVESQPISIRDFNNTPLKIQFEVTGGELYGFYLK